MKPGKSNLIWVCLLLLSFARPFLCQMCYPALDLHYSLVLLLFFLLWLLLRPKGAAAQKPLPRALVLLCISLTTSTLFSINLYYSLVQLYKFVIYLAVFYLISKISSRQKRELLLAIVAAAFLLSLHGIYQFFWGFQHVWDYLAQTGPDPLAEEFLSRKRVFATFFSPDMFAGYLIIMIPVTLGLFLDSLIKKKRLIYLLTGVGLFVMTVSFVLTKSLGAGLSLFLALLVFAVLLSILRPDLRPKLVPVAIITAGLIICILAVTLIGRAGYLLDSKSPHNSIIQRWYFWQAAVRMIKDFPLTGVGLGNFGLVYPKYQAVKAIESNFAHNSYLQIWAETGILGIISIFWLVISALRAGLRNLQGNTDKIMIIGLLCANLAFLIHNLVDFSFFVPEVALIWWVVLGMTFSQRSCLRD